MPRLRKSTSEQTTSLPLSVHWKRAQRVVFKVKKSRRVKAKEKKESSEAKADSAAISSSSAPSPASVNAQALSSTQSNALEQLRASAMEESKRALKALEQRAILLGSTTKQVQRWLEFIRDKARLLIHIDLCEKAEALLADTEYR